MNKLLFAMVLGITAIAGGQTQEAAAAPAPGLMVDPTEKVIASGAKIPFILGSAVTKANLPPEFQEQANDIMLDAQKQLEECEKIARQTKIFWMYRVCMAGVIKSSMNQLKVLETQVTSTVAPELTGSEVAVEESAR